MRRPRVMVEMIIGVTMRIAVEEKGGWRAGIYYKTMIEDLTIGDIKLEMELKRTFLVEESTETGVRVKILVEVNQGLRMFYIMRFTREISHQVVSRSYRYDRVKQEILYYHVDKMLKEGNIIPIKSPYASPVVLCRKNNGLPPDNPEAYRFAADYRKLNAITKYPRYPLLLIDD
ncbi:retrovirus-related Pol polyprotein from transposon 297 [Trichonephila clavipes]|nr:retrovirus-related Pol polyprotein from transposon 297 [Trichonephila clavipes]